MTTKVCLSSALFLVVLFAALAPSAIAQERPAPAIEFAAGGLFFPDDGENVGEGFAGGNARFYLTPRFSVGPEIAFVGGSNHSHLMVTGNATYDFIGPENGRQARVTPFVVIGAGLFRTNETFFDDAVSSSEGAFTAGGGVRARLGNRVILGAEGRVGWELHTRFNGLIGIAF